MSESFMCTRPPSGLKFEFDQRKTETFLNMLRSLIQNYDQESQVKKG